MGLGNGRGQGLGRSTEGFQAGAGVGRGFGNSRGRGLGRNRGQLQAGAGAGRGFGNGRGRGLGRNTEECQIDAGPGKGLGGGRGQGLGRTPGGENAAAPTLPPDQARLWIGKLQDVLEAELYAKEYYQAAARALNGFPRFQNLARAENNHANAIAYAITSLGGTPNWVQNEPITPPASIAAADAHCQEIELHVIEIYAGMIADAPTNQLLMIFENIQKANRHHLRVVGG